LPTKEQIDAKVKELTENLTNCRGNLC